MSDPIRIAQVVGNMNGGGVEAVIMNYYRNIDRSRFQFDFLVNEGSTLVPKEEIESLGGRVFTIPGYTHQLSYQKQLTQLFSEQGYPIVHSHINTLSVLSLRAAKKAHVPIRIAHSHNTAGKGETARNILKGVLRGFSDKYPTHHFACGELAGKWLFKDASFEIIPNAIELDEFAFDQAVRTETREELGVDNSTLVIGHVGRFVPQKNHRFLLEAFALLCGNRENCLLVCAGDGKLLEETKDYATELGIKDKVSLIGQREDVNRFYSTFDVFALPSLYEGLCVVGIEAQRSGLPCLFSDQITRELSITEKAVYLPIEEPQVWADAMAAIDADGSPEHRTVDTALFADYDIGIAAKQLEDHYQELLDSAKGGL